MANSSRTSAALRRVGVRRPAVALGADGVAKGAAGAVTFSRFLAGQHGLGVGEGEAEVDGDPAEGDAEPLLDELDGVAATAAEDGVPLGLADPLPVGLGPQRLTLPLFGSMSSLNFCSASAALLAEMPLRTRSCARLVSWSRVSDSVWSSRDSRSPAICPGMPW